MNYVKSLAQVKRSAERLIDDAFFSEPFDEYGYQRALFNARTKAEVNFIESIKYRYELGRDFTPHEIAEFQNTEDVDFDNQHRESVYFNQLADQVKRHTERLSSVSFVASDFFNSAPNPWDCSSRCNKCSSHSSFIYCFNYSESKRRKQSYGKVPPAIFKDNEQYVVYKDKYTYVSLEPFWWKYKPTLDHLEKYMLETGEVPGDGLIKTVKRKGVNVPTLISRQLTEDEKKELNKFCKDKVRPWVSLEMYLEWLIRKIRKAIFVYIHCFNGFLTLEEFKLTLKSIKWSAQEFLFEEHPVQVTKQGKRNAKRLSDISFIASDLFYSTLFYSAPNPWDCNNECSRCTQNPFPISTGFVKRYQMRFSDQDIDAIIKEALRKQYKPKKRCVIFNKDVFTHPFRKVQIEMFEMGKLNRELIREAYRKGITSAVDIAKETELTERTVYRKADSLGLKLSNSRQEKKLTTYAKVQAWKQENERGKQKECALVLGLGIATVKRHWKPGN